MFTSILTNMLTNLSSISKYLSNLVVQCLCIIRIVSQCGSDWNNPACLHVVLWQHEWQSLKRIFLGYIFSSDTINKIKPIGGKCLHHLLAHGRGSSSRNESVIDLFDVTHLWRHTDHTKPSASVHGKASRNRKMMENKPNRNSLVSNSTDDCAVCLDTIQEKKTLKCLHSFCSQCIDSVFKLKPACPICNTYHGVYTGTQPQGTMTVTRSWQDVPGFEHCGSITIHYYFSSGTQGVRRNI